MTRLEVHFRDALKSRKPQDIAKATDFARRIGMKYNEVLSIVQKIEPSMDAAEWDALLYEADESEAAS